MNGFVGMNPEELKQRIEAVYQRGIDLIMNPLGEATVDFFSSIRYAWFSPKAVEFYDKHADRIVQSINDVVKTLHDYCLKAADAYNIMAFANGLPTFEANLYPAKILTLPKTEDNLNGEVGMDTISVQYVLDIFERKVRIKLNNFDKLPQYLPVYDANNAMQNAYRQAIANLKTRFTEEFEYLMNDIKYYIETAERNVNVSSRKAFEALNIDVTKQEWSPKAWAIK